MTTIYTLAIDTPEGITTGVIASTDAVEIGSVVTVCGHDSNGMPIKQAGIVLEVLREETNS
jgi:hypothetical protein